MVWKLVLCGRSQCSVSVFINLVVTLFVCFFFLYLHSYEETCKAVGYSTTVCQPAVSKTV